MTDLNTTTHTVRQQYEALPYPYRDPEALKDRSLFCYQLYLDALNHHCYGGLRDFNKPFRVLDIGGGTGDGTTFLAEQLAHTQAEIVYLDLSAASLKIAKRRVELKGINQRCHFIQDSLFNLSKLHLGQFDHIHCNGVLHHLDEPQLGLQCLASVLKENGTMSLMVYGQYARAGIYPLQKLMRILNRNETDVSKKISNTRMVLSQLPTTNWFNRLGDLFSHLDDDTELYDLLLHSKDRPFSIPEVLDWLSSVDLEFIKTVVTTRPFYNHPIQPGQHPQLEKRLNALDSKRRHAYAEINWGIMKTHEFWAGSPQHQTADPANPDMVPIISRIPSGREVFEHYKNPQLLVLPLHQNNRLNDGKKLSITIELPLTPIVRAFLPLINGQRTMQVIIDQLCTQRPENRETIQEVCYHAIRLLAERDTVLLRHKEVRPLEW